MNTKLLRTYISAALAEGILEKRKINVDEVVGMLSNRVLIYYDTETTGFNPRKPYIMITEIAAIAIDTNTGEELDTYNFKSELRPETLDKMDRQQAQVDAGEWKDPKKPTIKDILKKTGYYDEDGPPKIEEIENLKGFAEFIEKFRAQNPMIVAHNANFDMHQINSALERFRIPKIRGIQVIDTLALVKNYLKPLLLQLEKEQVPEAQELLVHLRPQKRWLANLGAVGGAFKAPNEAWHKAIADAKQLSIILPAMLDFFRRYSGPNVSNSQTPEAP